MIVVERLLPEKLSRAWSNINFGAKLAFTLLKVN